MLLKLNVAAAKRHAPAGRIWSTMVAYIRTRCQRSRDRHILMNMNEHDLRDLGLTRPQGGIYHRNL
jgi:uncharacterized protein YjiS (DUF1127 family)